MDQPSQGGTPGARDASDARRPRPRWQLLLLLIPFVALLYPPFYATTAPRLWGVPFFIWYQFLWVILGVLVTAVVSPRSSRWSKTRWSGSQCWSP